MYSTVTMTNPNFTAWLEEEMRREGLSNAELAQKAGVTRGAIGNLLRGERGPGMTLVVAIANALDRPPEMVFRKAVGLPEDPGYDEETERVVHLFRQLDDPNKTEVIEYLEMKLRHQEARRLLEEADYRLVERRRSPKPPPSRRENE
jgi:transcriptional regulator with XRE-family HTH domain